MINIEIQKIHDVSVSHSQNILPVIAVKDDCIVFGVSEPLKDSLRVKDQINCLVNLGESSIETKLSILAVTGHEIEGKIISPMEEYNKIVNDYFRAEIMAESLKEIPKEKINNTGEGTPHWHYGNTEYEIFFNVDEKETPFKVCRFQINFNTEILSFDGSEVTIGDLWEEEQSDRFSHKGSHLIQDKRKFSSEKIKNLFRFVKACSDIDEQYQSQILALIERRFEKDFLK
jgi:hypothetical protein